ncbi:MAG TPA: (d)CMP kinase [Blastocatellia bacterium]|nr:(d)CMP kinase [Blastocatellia bacterium]
MKRLVIAIDGPTAAGKSTAGRSLAAKLGYVYIDSGAMYRAVGWKAIADGVALDDDAALTALASRIRIGLGGDPQRPTVTVDGCDVTALIRTPAVDAAASRVSVVPGVRAAMVAQQQELGRDGGVVMDGRDIGTHVFPNADVKFFLVADPSERARRRHDENVARGRDESLDTTRAAIDERDHRDTTRDAAPLRTADDSVSIDTTSLSPDALVARMLEIVESRR